MSQRVGHWRMLEFSRLWTVGKFEQSHLWKGRTINTTIMLSHLASQIFKWGFYGLNHWYLTFHIKICIMCSEKTFRLNKDGLYFVDSYVSYAEFYIWMRNILRGLISAENKTGPLERLGKQEQPSYGLGKETILHITVTWLWIGWPWPRTMR